ncbi:MAG: TatD family hydrolase [Verrucomicrobia bacterium]|nr:TatD family hydrolase [Verrucomicrobiota bacterium]
MLIDTHAHLDFPEFEGELDAVLDRAAQAGVTRVVTIGTSVESSRRAVAIAQAHPAVYAAIGIHPGSATEAGPDALAALRELAQSPRVIAIGETGLDYYRLPGTGGDEAIKAAQAAVFQLQLDLAVECGLNVVIHQRGDCLQDTLALLAPYQGKFRAVFHCFGGSPETAAALLALGHLVSFTGIVTFKNAGLMGGCAASVPDASYMVETDCPYLAPTPFRGRRCEPAYTRQIAEKIAALRNQPLERIAKTTTATAEAFFRFPPLHG